MHLIILPSKIVYVSTVSPQLQMISLGGLLCIVIVLGILLYITCGEGDE
jgi:hypothetical protein